MNAVVRARWKPVQPLPLFLEHWVRRSANTRLSCAQDCRTSIRRRASGALDVRERQGTPHEGSVVVLPFVLSMLGATGHAVTAPSHLAPGTRNVQLPPESTPLSRRRARVPSAPTVLTAWVFRTCSGTCGSGQRSAGGVIVVSACFTAAVGPVGPTSTSAPSSFLQTIGLQLRLPRREDAGVVGCRS